MHLRHLYATSQLNPQMTDLAFGSLVHGQLHGIRRLRATATCQERNCDVALDATAVILCNSAWLLVAELDFLG